MNKFRTSILLTLSVMVLFAGQAKAAVKGNPDFNVDGIYYKFTGDGTVQVTFKGEVAIVGVSHMTYSGDITIPATVDYEGNTYTVTSIGVEAFYYCSIESIVLPNTITSIEGEAFRGCTSLKQIELPYNLKTIGHSAFAISGIQTIMIPNGVETLPNFVFRESELTQITLSSSIKSIGKEAFYNSKLSEIYIPEGLEEIGESAFRGTPLTEITTPTTLKTIGERAFQDSQIKNIILREGLTTIGKMAFYQTQLTELTLPKTIEEIGVSAFCRAKIEHLSFETPSRLTGLQDAVFGGNPLVGKITIPASVESIGYNAFSGCNYDVSIFEIDFEEGSQLSSIGEQAFKSSNLLSLKFPNGVKTIGNSAFQSCLKLEEAIMPEGLESIGAKCFQESGIMTATIPSTVNKIGECAFDTFGSNHSSYHTVVINLDTNTTDIGDGCFMEVSTINVSDLDAWTRVVVNGRPFRYCDRSHWTYSRFSDVYYNGQIVTDYTVPEGLESVDDHSFYQNEDIKNVTLPNSLKTIGEMAFYKCTALEKIVFGNSVQEVGNEAFRYDTAIKTVDIGDIANWCNISFYASTSNPITQAGRIVLNGQELEALTIPSTVTKIGNFAFNGCQRFSSLTIPNAVTSIGAYAFNECTDLESVNFGKRPKIEKIDTYAFANTGITSINLPSTITDIGAYAFYKCNMLQNITIPNGIKEIRKSTFENCSSIRQVVIPEGLEVIGQRAFYYCENIEKIEMPVSLKAIYAGAFQGVNLNIYIKDLFAWCNVKTDNCGNCSWGDQKHFYLNNELTKNLVIPAGITSLSHNLFEYATDIEALTLPEGLKVIEWGCFQYCYNIKEVYVPTSIEKVELCAFRLYYTHLECPRTNVAFHTNDLFSFINSNMAVSIKTASSKNLFNELYVKGELIKDLVIPEGIKTLGGDSNYSMYLFDHFNFTSVTLPKSLESIAGSVFNSCYNLKNIYCRGKYAATSLEKYDHQKGIWLVSSFNISNLYKDFQGIYVPKERGNNYKSKWPINSDYIFETPSEIVVTDNITAESINTIVQRNAFVYGEQPGYIDLVQASIDESVTTDVLQNIADLGTIVFLPENTDGIEGDNIVSHGKASKIVLHDGVDVNVPYNFAADEVIYQREFEASRTDATTLCLPFSMNTLPDGMKAHSLRGLNEQGNAIFDEMDAIEANKPYLITTTKSITDITALNVQFEATPGKMPEVGSDDLLFVGTLSTISHEDAAADEDYYLDTDLEWKSVYDAADVIYIPAGRAYLIPLSSWPEKIRSILKSNGIDGDADGDGNVTMTDVMLMMSYILGECPEGFDAAAADMNGDGYVTITDVLIMLDNMK